ncbi:MAG: hypothetical protein A3H95_03235 [Acidobacteria bacterium RIFCSPLOWO2_02_FULL_64_15]|nr:MAG: hypothetical protein A3H95_03235 [Acidobacteria bacterium RIFCSPLOWO2_02_FULL_64_15]
MRMTTCNGWIGRSVSVSVVKLLPYRTRALNFIPVVLVGPCRSARMEAGSTLPGLFPQKITPPALVAGPGAAGA